MPQAFKDYAILVVDCFIKIMRKRLRNCYVDVFEVLYDNLSAYVNFLFAFYFNLNVYIQFG